MTETLILSDHDKQIAKKQDRVSENLFLYDCLTEDSQKTAFLLMNSLDYYRFSDRSPDCIAGKSAGDVGQWGGANA